MDENKDLKWTFDTAASVYERYRPEYPGELYKMIFDYSPLNEFSHAAEIGIGGGQATLPFLNTGCSLTAVEYGENFSVLCREKFKKFRNFSIITDKFENAELRENIYDLVYSATAFHWIPENIGYAKVLSMLKNGGAFARFANHPFRDKGNPSLSEEIDRIYTRYYYPFHNIKPEPQTEFSEEQARKTACIAGKYGFTDIRYALFYRTRTFSAGEYCALLGTYSDHIAMNENIRMKFFSEIADAINKHGGSIKIYDTIDLQLARKP